MAPLSKAGGIRRRLSVSSGTMGLQVIGANAPVVEGGPVTYAGKDSRGKKVSITVGTMGLQIKGPKDQVPKTHLYQMMAAWESPSVHSVVFETTSGEELVFSVNNGTGQEIVDAVQAATMALDNAMRDAQRKAHQDEVMDESIQEGDEFEEMSDSSDEDDVIDDVTNAAEGKTRSDKPGKSKKKKKKKREAVAGAANALSTSIDLVSIPKYDTAKVFLRLAFAKQPLFEAMDETQLEQFVDCMTSESLAPGHTLITQGDIGDKFYVVESGSLDCSIGGQIVAQYTDGQTFGELALLYDTPRAATVVTGKASTSVVVWSIDVASFKQITVHGAADKRERVLAILSTVSILQPLSKARLTSMAEAMGSRRYATGEVIVTQGEEGSIFYILQEGEAVVSVDGIGEVARKHAGEGFGETALQNNAPRNATITAAAPSLCLTLSRDDFQKLIGDLDKLVSQSASGGSGDYDDDAAGGGITPGTRALKEQEDLEASDQVMTFFDDVLTLDDFEQGALLGRGSFGRVVHAKHKATGGYYALKCLSKTELIRNGQVPHLMNEKDVLQVS